MSSNYKLTYMKTIGERIRKLRTELKYTQAQVAKAVGIKAPSVTQWESDKTSPSGKSLIALADFLKTSPDYILYGTKYEAVSSQRIREDVIVYKSNTESADLSKSIKVPIISWVQAGDCHPAEVETDVDEIETVATYERVSPQTYALRVIGESMTTTSGPYSFPPGSIIIIDPDQCGDTADGVFVIAKENGADSVTFKQLKYDGARPYLNPLNADYPKFFGEFRIIGKVIDFRPVKLP